MRKNLFCIWGVAPLGLILTILGSSIAVAQEEAAQWGAYATIQGTVSFERRQTVIPLAVCESEPCLTAQSYWMMVVKAENARYEFNRIFAAGSLVAPESVEINSIVIRPGSHLAIEARVDIVTQDYGILSDIRSVEIIMDQRTQVTPFFGWTCHSVSESRPVYVDVIQVSRTGEYSMRIQSVGPVEGEPIQTVASFGRVSLKLTDEMIRFAGTSQNLSAELHIDQREGRLYDFESSLKLISHASSLDNRSPAEVNVRLTCNRTR